MAVGQDVGGMSGGQHPAFGQKCHMIGEHRRQVQIMHHRDDPSACVGIAARKGHHLQLVADVQTGHRLVQKSQRGPSGPVGSQTCASTRASCTRCCSPPDSS